VEDIAELIRVEVEETVGTAMSALCSSTVVSQGSSSNESSSLALIFSPPRFAVFVWVDFR
jgi:hypothetical protein